MTMYLSRTKQNSSKQQYARSPIRTRSATASEFLMGESSTQISDDFSKHLEAEVQSSKCHINASVSRLLKEIEKLNGNNGKMDKKPRKPAKKRQSKKCKILNTKLDPMCNQTPTVESPTLPRIPSSEWVYQTPKRQRIKRCAVLSALSESEWIEAVRLDTTEETISITTTTSQSGYNTTFEESNTDIVSDVRKYINSSTDRSNSLPKFESKLEAGSIRGFIQ